MDPTDTTITPGQETPQGAPAEAALDSGGYDVLRSRLSEQGRELSARAEALNTRRKAIFGSTELTITASERVRTEQACVPRDLVHLGGQILVGFNAFLGLKTERVLADVFSLHQLRSADGGFDLAAVPADSAPGLFADPRFNKDFQELYRFYRGARLIQLLRSEGRLLAVFQTGSETRDIRVFRFAMDGAERLSYIDDRGEGELPRLPSHDFEWTATSREDHVAGRHPHVSILNEVFVETVGGDLTVKVEDNTEDGEGIYREPVEDRNQALDDARILYAKLGALILLRILPFREEVWRHLVYNTRTRQVVRLDTIGRACLQLPENHGIIFPGGYYLQTGEHKVFEGDTSGFEWNRVIRSPNGEDVLFVCYDRVDGIYAIYPYNLIRKEVQTPVTGQGFTLLGDGTMVVLRAVGEEAERVHPVQIWKTPFVSAEHQAQTPSGDGSYLGKVGNAELVRGISDLGTVCRYISAEQPGRRTYEDIIKAATRALDNYFWLAHEEVGGVAPSLQGVRRTAELILGEYDKVVQVRRRAADALREAEQAQRKLLDNLRPEDLPEVASYLDALTALRTQRGRLVTLRELRYMDLARVEALQAEASEAFDRLSGATVEFLLRPEAMAPVVKRIGELLEGVAPLEKSQEGEPLREELAKLADGLNLLAEVAGGLQVADPTARAAILEHISEVMARQNRARAVLDGKLKELKLEESRLEFAAQFRLLGQSVQGSLAAAGTPEQCDEQLGRLMVQLEDLEGRFGELEEFASDLLTRREEVYEAFGARKQVLLEERQRRAETLVAAAERILAGVRRRAATLDSEADLESYFAADSLVEKLRQTAGRLRELKDSVRADELEGKLKALRQDSLRALRDRRDLLTVEDGATYIRFGRHRFSVNTQPMELTLVPREGGLAVHLTGTDFFEPVSDPALLELRDIWDQPLLSETAEVYRGEYLAGCLLLEAEEGAGGRSVEELSRAAAEGTLAALVRKASQERYEEGYEPGVHDADAAAILERLVFLKGSAGLLGYPPGARALAGLYWSWLGEDAPGARLVRQSRSLQRLAARLGPHPARERLAREVAELLAAFAKEQGLADLAPFYGLAGRYLTLELGAEQVRFCTASESAALRDALLSHLDLGGTRHALEEDLRLLAGDAGRRFSLARAWLEAFLASDRCPDGLRGAGPVVAEAALLLACPEQARQVSGGQTTAEVSGLLGRHPRVRSGKLQVRIDELLARVGAFREERVPRHRAFRKATLELLERQRRRLRPSELRPRVLSTFVRNRLINEVYLPLIADNLAKQMGAAGENKRTDLQGLLLLISPPGYGKTTLVEYLASQLGLAFIKINGPALGHAVTSLDPSEATSAPARREVQTINLALKMGNNVLLYLDDIQHTSPELLQKFISLCDAQRRIEGVWEGQSEVFDLRGKKFCVVMAGNPYTESGALFRIPDMLANRADTYNLGDVLSGKEELFALSYLENSLTSNPALQPLSSRDPADIGRILRMARGEEVPTSELSYGYSSSELSDMVEVMRKLLRVQAVLLRVNQTYIESAGQEDAYRTEPPFKLQGSYRNMNKIAEKVVSVMNDQELERVLDDHYAGEAQTLTTGAEQNLLKLAELRGRLAGEDAARWVEIKRGFARLLAMGSKEDDPATRVVGQLVALGQQIDGVRQVLAASDAGQQLAGLFEGVSQQLGGIRESIEETDPSERLALMFSGLGRELHGIQAALADTGAQDKLAAQLGVVERRLGGIHGALASPEGRDKLSSSLSSVEQRLGGIQAALSSTTSQERISTLVQGLGRELAGIRAALRDPGGQSRLADRLTAVGQELAGVKDALKEAQKASQTDEERARSLSTRSLAYLADIGSALAALPEALKQDPGAARQGELLAEKLGVLATELQGIRTALGEGSREASRMSRDTDRMAAVSFSGPPAALAGPPARSTSPGVGQPPGAALSPAGGGEGAWLEPLLARLQQTLGELGRPQVELTVHNEPPAGIQELLAQQVAIAERTLIPLVRTATKHLGDGAVLDQKLGQLMELLQRVDARLRAGIPATLENVDAARRDLERDGGR